MIVLRNITPEKSVCYEQSNVNNLNICILQLKPALCASLLDINKSLNMY